MRKLLLIACIVLSGTVFSQGFFNPLPSDTVNPYPRFTDRLFYGGNVGLWVGNPTFINLSPMVGVMVTKRIGVGGSFTYNYYQQTYNGYKYKDYIWGGGPLVRVKILENLFAQAEWDRLSVRDPNLVQVENNRVWIDMLLVGGGYRQPFSDYGSFVIMAFWNLNESPLSPYPNPIFQVGFNLGF